MKLKLEPPRAISMLKQSLGYGKAPVRDQCIMLVTPEGVQIAYALAADTLVFANYSKGYFKSIESADTTQLLLDWAKLGKYETQEENDAAYTDFLAKYATSENVIISTLSFVKDRIAYGFSGDELTITADATKLYADGTDHIDETRVGLTKELLEAKAPLTSSMTDIGLNLIPSQEVAEQMAKTGQHLFNLQALISTEAFSDLPSYDTVIFDTDGTNLTMHLGDQLGNRKRPIPIKQYALNNTPQASPAGTPLKVKFNMKLIQQLLSQFDGDVWLSLNGGSMVLSQKYPEYCLTYVIAAYEGEQ
jgi:hypothetical protein